MGYIYKITNKINGKVYIGQTITSIQERMRKHYSDARCEPGVTGIDAAIRKYGKENFQVEEICKCKDDELTDLEIFYIAKYDCYNTPKGYNLTPGGQQSGIGSFLQLDTQEVIAKYQELKSVKDVASCFNCCEKTISNLLHANNVVIKRGGNNPQNIIGKGKQFKEGDGVKAVRVKELDKEFPSLKECAQWLIDNKYSKASSMEMARKSLSRCLTGERNSYCKLHFEYI